MPFEQICSCYLETTACENYPFTAVESEQRKYIFIVIRVDIYAVVKLGITVNLGILGYLKIYRVISRFPVSVSQMAHRLDWKSRKENPQKLTQFSSRSHPRHLVGKRTAQKDTIIDITSDSQVNSNFPNRWSPASLTFNNYFYLSLYLYIT